MKANRRANGQWDGLTKGLHFNRQCYDPILNWFHATEIDKDDDDDDYDDIGGLRWTLDQQTNGPNVGNRTRAFKTREPFEGGRCLKLSYWNNQWNNAFLCCKITSFFLFALFFSYKSIVSRFLFIWILFFFFDFEYIVIFFYVLLEFRIENYWVH